MSEYEEKKAFAKALFENSGNAFDAAYLVFKGDSSKAIIASNKWVNDEVVVRELKILRGEKADVVTLPSREEHCRHLYDMFQDKSLKASDRLTASEQYARIQGEITPDKTPSIINNKIMIVPSNGSDQEWMEKARRNQEDLKKGIVRVEAIEVKDENA